MKGLPPFISGLALSEGLYFEVIRPLVERHRPRLRYSAALVGEGSEVIGLDDARSRDHDWGPRALLFLSESDHAREAEPLRALLRAELPASFRGYPVHFGPPDPSDGGTRTMTPGAAGAVDSRVDVSTWGHFVARRLGRDRARAPTLTDWLTFPEQALLEITAGRVFHDGLRALVPTRERFAYFPRDVWLHRLAAQWQQIAQEEPFVGRAAEAGDDLGSRIVAARIARYAMRLGFLMERRYAPYSKWLGSALRQLRCGERLTAALAAALAADSYPEREAGLCTATEMLALMHNALGLTEPLDASPRGFFDRPYRVIGADRFDVALRAQIQDEHIRGLPSLLGAADQLIDVSSAVGSPRLTGRMRPLYT